ncbi:MAG TPA: carboxypeptidase regulatory-like domain-containing protein [Polyangiaceae bacterium]|nr:carboxypeptidase regulatory-like domain-containing protein [Polyangiaceae bacterium]
MRPPGAGRGAPAGKGPRPAIGAALVGALIFAPQAEAAPVRGKVGGLDALLNPVWNEARDVASRRYTWREQSPTVLDKFRHLTASPSKEVCIVAFGEGAPVRETVQVRLGGGRTTPVTLVVTPGATIDLLNRDAFRHRPYIVNQPSFQAADMAAGTNRQWKVPGPGTYELRDELFPSVRSWIVVEPNAVARTHPAADGSFAFANLPPGEYTLRAYFSGAPAGAPRPIKVTEKALEIKEALALDVKDKAQ